MKNQSHCRDCEDEDEYSIAIKRNQVTMAVIRFRENQRMKKINNYKYFYFLLRYIYTDKEEQEEYKRALISRITDGRTTSLREIDDREYFTLINQLEDIVGIKDKIRKERSATLKLLQKEFNVDTTNWNKVDAICLFEKDCRESPSGF